MFLILKNQIQLLTNEKQDLEVEMSKINVMVKSAAIEQERMKELLEVRSSELEEKECKITSLYNLIEVDW